ncbi:unnamed protein product, partial [Rotaria sp. Silwood2]
RGITKETCYPTWNLYEFVSQVFHHLPRLRSVDFGMEQSFFVHTWHTKMSQHHLTYMRITLITLCDLLCLMLTQPLSRSLKQLHVCMGTAAIPSFRNVRVKDLWPRMEALRTFTFAKSFYWYFDEEWALIDRITSARVMPILERMNFAIVINNDDLDLMRHSALFNDYRNVAVHYAFIINDGESHMKLSECVPRGSQTHPRQIGSAAFVCECLPNNQLFQTSGESYVSFDFYNYYTLLE